MGEELAEYVDGVPARFVPDEMRGELVEAEHLTRYWWAAGLVGERRVLDAGCGIGYGSAILAGGGATDVVGVDLAEAVVAAAAGAIERPGLRFEQGDVTRLEHPDDSFDAIVCFEVIEHVEDPDAVLAEFARVLAPGGVLAISSPNRDAYVPGNPHHHKEFTPTEFDAALGRHWPNVRLLRQHNWIASAVLDEVASAYEDGEEVDRLAFRKALGQAPGQEPYTLALASSGELPDPPPTAVATGVTEVRRWLGHYDDQQRVLDEQRQLITKLQAEQKERAELRVALIRAENVAARVPELEVELEERQDDIDTLHTRLKGAERIIDDVVDSPSWRITRPLRSVKTWLDSRRA